MQYLQKVNFVPWMEVDSKEVSEMLLIIINGVTVYGFGCISALRLKVVLLYSLSGLMEDRGTLILLMRSLFGVIFIWETTANDAEKRGEYDWAITIQLPPINSGCSFLYDTKSILCSLVCRSGIVCCMCFSLTSVSCSVMWFWSRSSVLCVGPIWPPCRPYLRPRRALKKRSADRWGTGMKQYSCKIKEVGHSLSNGSQFNPKLDQKMTELYFA